MALAHSPRIVTDGLVLAIDAGNLKSFINTGDKNLINPSTWVPGTTGSQTGFTMNGLASENRIISGTDPFGSQASLWEAVPSGDGNADGGWATSSFAIDPTKTYRFSTWINRTVAGANGHAYLGLSGYNAAMSNIGVLNRVSGVNSTNPYFWVTSSPPTPAQLTTGEWTLVVGHVHPAGSGTGSSHPDSGAYTLAGRKTSSAGITDYVWNTDNARTHHRSYLYYAPNTTARQRWAYPRVDLVDGTEPSIADLIANKVNNLYAFNLIGAQEGTIRNGVAFNSANGGSFVFDGTNDVITLGDVLNMPTNNFTLSAWVKSTSTAPGNNNGIIYKRGTSYPYTAGYRLCMPGGTFNLHIADGTDRESLTTPSSSYNDGKWHHVVGVVRRNDKLELYVDGVLATQTASTLATSITTTTPLSIGALFIPESVYHPFLGNISAVQVYNRALSETEVKQNFNALRGRFGL